MKNILLLLTTLLSSSLLIANNLRISTPYLNGSNQLVFAVSWDNSWYTSSAPNNWDGVYLFIKYRDCASTNAWQHAIISTNVADHSVEAPLIIDSYKLSDGRGLIVRRSGIGSGNIVNDTVKIKINTPGPGASYDFQVFGIEMVYIPTASFYLGDGTSTYTITNGGTSSPFLVTNDNAITRGAAAGQIYCNPSPGTLPADIPAPFPVGYDSFYVMKYEITQAQYVAFLNTLSSDQAANRGFIYNANRINIGGAWPNFTTNFPHRAMGMLSWYDLLAYLDWAALRPMTETEYEKICRGPNVPVAGEYAWGTGAIFDCNAITADGTNTETNTNLPPAGSGIANFNNDVVIGPMRSGFAATPTSNRLQAGAGYYGVMELSGNVWELCVNISQVEGRSFTGLNGDGSLTSAPTAGFANTANWPSTSATTLGYALRGGAYDAGAALLRVSNRSNYFWNDGGRNPTVGGRGCR